MPLLIKLVISGICGCLDAWGGHGFLAARRYIMPIVIGISFVVITHIWWTALLSLPAIGTLSLGYSKDGNFGRGLWMCLHAFALGMGITLTGHVWLSWFIFVPYLVGAGFLGGIYRNWEQILGDLVTGFYLSLIILVVR